MPEWKEEIRQRLASLKLGPTREAEIVEELAQHLEERYEELLGSGVTKEKASLAALAELNESDFLAQELRRVERPVKPEAVVLGARRINLLGDVFQDLRYGLRMMRKSPWFAAVCILMLALGIGANTAIFTVLNAVMLRSLPVKDPQQLVILSDPDSQGWKKGWETETRTLFSYHEFEWLRDHNQIFSGVFAVNTNLLPLEVAVTGAGQSGETVNARVSLVSGAYFSVLGVNASRGRTFSDDVDKVKNANPVAVISYNYWKNHFALDPAVLLRKIRIRQTTFDIIGVTPEGFSGETVGHSPDMWIPLTMQMEVFPGWGDSLSPPTTRSEGQVMWLHVMARRKPGVTLAQARFSINVAFQQMLQSEAGELSVDARREYLNQNIALVEGGRGASTLHESFGEPLLILMGLVGLVLLIACANVANLLLARAATRQREIALRVALGASRRRLAQQLLTESVLLALVGGALGLLLAHWADAVLLRLVSSGSLPIPLDLHPDVRILGFTVGVSLLAGILFGLTPALRAARVDLNAVLKGAAKGNVAGGAQAGKLPVGKILVVGQVALSFLLLVAAGLLVRSFQKLTRLNPGYDRDNLLLVRVYPEPTDYKGTALTQLDHQLLERLRTIPGAKGATLSSRGLFNFGEVELTVWLEGDAPPPSQPRSATFDFVGSHYFSTLNMPILAGREIGPEDEGNAQRVGVINQTMARTYFGDANPIGRRFRADRDHPFDILVIGVAADGKYNNLREQTPSQCYLSYFHSKSEAPHATFEVRVAGNAAAAASAIRAAVKETAPGLRPPEIHTMSEIVDQSLTTERMLTQLSGFFGVLALLLACIGLYGLMSYNVAGRTNEIGIRMALGAKEKDVLKLVVKNGMTLALIGIAVGLLGAFALTRLMTTLLFGVTPTDAATFVVVPLGLMVVALLACYIPARQATKVNPLVALRYE